MATTQIDCTEAFMKYVDAKLRVEFAFDTAIEDAFVGIVWRLFITAVITGDYDRDMPEEANDTSEGETESGREAVDAWDDWSSIIINIHVHTITGQVRTVSMNRTSTFIELASFMTDKPLAVTFFTKLPNGATKRFHKWQRLGAHLEDDAVLFMDISASGGGKRGKAQTAFKDEDEPALKKMQKMATYVARAQIALEGADGKKPPMDKQLEDMARRLADTRGDDSLIQSALDNMNFDDLVEMETFLELHSGKGKHCERAFPDLVKRIMPLYAAKEHQKTMLVNGLRALQECFALYLHNLYLTDAATVSLDPIRAKVKHMKEAIQKEAQSSASQAKKKDESKRQRDEVLREVKEHLLKEAGMDITTAELMVFKLSAPKD
jgi:hypothetical protein